MNESYLSIGIIIIVIIIMIYEFCFNNDVKNEYMDINIASKYYKLRLIKPMNTDLSPATNLMWYKEQNKSFYVVNFENGTSTVFNDTHCTNGIAQQKNSEGKVIFSFNKNNGDVHIWQGQSNEYGEFIYYKASMTSSSQYNNSVTIGKIHIHEDLHPPY